MIKTFQGHRAGRWGCGVVVVDGRRHRRDEAEEFDQVEDGREGKRRKLSPHPETTETPATEEPITNPLSNPPADHLRNDEPINPRVLSAPSRPTQAATPTESDTAYIVTGTDTPSAILYDLQSRTILQRLNPRIHSNLTAEPIAPEHTATGPTAPELAAPEPTAAETSAAALAAHEKEAAAAGDEEEACLAVGAHPYRRELAIGGLGEGGVVRIWRDFS